MFKKTFLLLCCTCLAVAGFAQQLNVAVISAAGDANKTDKLYLQWTLGEPVIESISTNNNLYTQGFHQPLKLTQTQASKAMMEQEWHHISILPNPVQSIGKVVIQRAGTSKLHLTLFDITGKALMTKTSYAKYEIIDLNLSAFSSGVYTLSIINTSGSLNKTYKIIKAL